MAWCLDVGQGWRVRVLTRGQWRAFGAIIDLDTAKKVALADIEACRKNSRYEPGGGA
jgi:hypothetical protein